MKLAIVLMVLALAGCKQKPEPVPVKSAGALADKCTHEGTTLVCPGSGISAGRIEGSPCDKPMDVFHDAVYDTLLVCSPTPYVSDNLVWVALRNGSGRISNDSSVNYIQSDMGVSAPKPVKEFGFGRTFRDFAGKEWYNDGKEWKKLPEGCILYNSEIYCTKYAQGRARTNR